MLDEQAACSTHSNPRTHTKSAFLRQGIALIVMTFYTAHRGMLAAAVLLLLVLLGAAETRLCLGQVI